MIRCSDRFFNGKSRTMLRIFNYFEYKFTNVHEVCKKSRV
jgi:hypothetical protein